MKLLAICCMGLATTFNLQTCNDTGTGGDGTGGVDTDTEPVVTPQQLGASVTEAHLSELLADLASGPRVPGSAGWQAAQDLCAQRFAAAGYEVELHNYGTGTNVIGRKVGTASPNEIVLLSAHYDTVADCPGADDNGSGVAGVIAAAEALSVADFERTLVVACWDQEEIGYVGSKAYATKAEQEGANIVAAVVFEMIGYSISQPNTQSLPYGFEMLFPAQAQEVADNDNRGDFITLVSDEGAAALTLQIEAASELAGTRAIALTVPDELLGSNLVGDLRRSDHEPFWQAGYPAIMITDTAELRNPGYHCYDAQDSLASIDFAFARNVTGSTVVALAQELGL